MATTFVIMEAGEVARRYTPPFDLIWQGRTRTVRDLRHSPQRRQVLFGFTDGGGLASPYVSYLTVEKRAEEDGRETDRTGD